ncbi:MAG: efflux RND transporter periplasmic adaptor subunit [Bacteroidota bacterium]
MKNLLLVLTILVIGCSQTQNVEEPDPQSLRPQQEPTLVKVIKAEIKPFNFYITCNGVVEAVRRSEVKFEQSGRLLENKIKNGQRVKKGQLLAKLDDGEERIALRKAEALLESKKYDYQSQMLSYSQKELDTEQGKTIIESIRHSTGLVDAEIGYDEAKIRLANTEVKAYISGTIANAEDLGLVYVNSGEKLCDIIDLTHLQVVTKVLESDLSKIELGTEAEVTALSMPGKKFSARVIEVNPIVDPTGMVDVKLNLLNTASLAPGMNVQIKFALTQNETLVIPKEALVIRSGREVVFVHEGGLAKWHYVTTGVTNGEEVEVLKGLEESMQVVTENNLQLAHDAIIKIQE